MANPNIGSFGGGNYREKAVQRLNTLKELRKSEIITDDDFSSRREQIFDELIDTAIDSPDIGRVSLMASSYNSTVYSRRYSKSLGSSPGESIQPVDSLRRQSRNSRNSRHHSIIQMKKHPPPDWNDKLYPVENATKITYNFATKEWHRDDVRVQLDTRAFDKGGLRLVFHLRDTSEPETAFVAKLSKDPRDNEIRSVYFSDVQMQAVAAHFARKYNSYNPPKRVEFISACVLELKQREGSPVCGVEKFIKGHYRKYNNNQGWISEDDRNTPASFSHFSYVVSDKELLICDIQGVGDIYTDPQIHSKDGKGFGKGNLGQEGINHFLSTHRCNRICQFLKLPNLAGLPYRNQGTLPFKTLMIQPEVTHLCCDELNNRLLPARFYGLPELQHEPDRDSYCFCSIV